MDGGWRSPILRPRATIYYIPVILFLFFCLIISPILLRTLNNNTPRISYLLFAWYNMVVINEIQKYDSIYPYDTIPISFLRIMSLFSQNFVFCTHTHFFLVFWLFLRVKFNLFVVQFWLFSAGYFTRGSLGAHTLVLIVYEYVYSISRFPEDCLLLWLLV